MSLRNNNYDLIERFFEFDLNDNELNAFQHKLQTEDDFKQQVEAYGQINRKINELIIPKTRETELKEVWIKELANRKKTDKSILKKLLIAAGFLLLFSLASWGFYHLIAPDNSIPLAVLADQYWESAPKTHLNLVRSEIATQTNLDEVIKLKNEGKYDAAFSLLEDSPDYLKSDNLYFLLKGELLIALKKPKESIEPLQKVIDQPELGFKDIALYYQAIAYIYLEDKEKAKANLEIIIHQIYPNKEAAEGLLNSLN